VSADERPDLDRELRRLFSDDRLNVPVSEKAAGVVIAGAHRRRRHRMAVAAAGGVLAVTGLVFAGVGLTGIGHQPNGITAAERPPSITLTATASPSTTTSRQRDADVLGPYGVDGLRLGMSAEQLQRQGLPLVPSSSRFSTCQTLTVLASVPPAATTVPTTTRTLPGTGDAPGAVVQAPSATMVPVRTTTAPVPQSDGTVVYRPLRVSVVMSVADDVVVQIGGRTGLRTPEGLGVGSSSKAVVQTYRSLRQPVNAKELVVAVPQNPSADYVFLLDGSGHVVEVWLAEAKYPDCTR
jgi:hypothetical protein